MSRSDDPLIAGLRFTFYPLEPGLSASAVFPEHASRCGIYMLYFRSGQRYVGQSRDVMARLAAHRRRIWGNEEIVGFAFTPAGEHELDKLERDVVQAIESQGVALLNIDLVGLPMGESRLDLIVERAEQERWLLESVDEPAVTEDWMKGIGDRAGLAKRRHATGEQFAKLSKRDDYGPIRLFLAAYLMDVIPRPELTERRFWTITAMPSTGRSRRWRRLAVVSVNNVETLVIGESEFEGYSLIEGYLNVAPSEIEWPGAALVDHYASVGEVTRLGFLGLRELRLLLEREDVISAARKLTLGLMRKGTGMMGRFHNVDLADDLFTQLDGPTFAWAEAFRLDEE